MTAITNVILIAFLTAGAWWLSGYDSSVTGENRTADVIRRAFRCGVTMVLLLLATLNPYFALFIFVLLGVIWASCGAEFFARRFHKIVDPDDDREFDPKEGDRNMDQLGRLIRQGRTNEALALCEKFEKSGEISPLTLEATRHRIYQDTLASIKISPVLREVRDFYERGEFEKAEAGLKDILAREPDSWSTMLFLMRIYVKGLSQPHKALALLEPAKATPPLHPAFVQYARRSIKQWIDEANQPAGDQGNMVTPQAESLIVEPELSIDDLLKSNQLATAVEHLEKELSGQPRNFELWLKLAEVYAMYCFDLNRAEKIIRKMELSSNFTPQEMELAKATLKEWRVRRR